MQEHAKKHLCVAWRISGQFVLLALILPAMLGAGILTAFATTAYAQSFRDVPADHPYVTAISDLASRSVISGFSDGTFRPDAPVTRQQFAKMIVKTLGLPVSAADTHPFADVLTDLNPADPFYPDKYIAVCYAKGLTEAKTRTTFAPFEDLSRAQLITFAARAAALPEPPAAYNPPFGEFSPDHYSWARKAAYAGLLDGLQGIGPGFDFFQSASRAECAQVFHNLLLRTQPAPAGATSSSARQYQLLSTSLSLAGAAQLASLPDALSPLPISYAIAGISVFVLAALAAVFLILRRSRSGRKQTSRRARSTRKPVTQHEAQALLRQWRDEKTVLRAVQDSRDQPAGASDSPPVPVVPSAASPPLAGFAKDSAGARLWDELLEKALAAKAASAAARFPRGRSKAATARRKEG